MVPTAASPDAGRNRKVCEERHDRRTAASSTALGITYGLCYPLIQAQAADSTQAGLRHWALWYFSLAYFAGLYGFPLLVGALITLGGHQALIACLLAIAALELAVATRLRPPKPVQADARHDEPPPLPRRRAPGL